MYILYLSVLLSLVWLVRGQLGKCDQTPPHTEVLEPATDKGIFHLDIQNAPIKEDKRLYTPDQTYVLTLYTTDEKNRPFRSFMITAEDPDVDNNVFEFSHKNIEVGTLKTLDADKSRYSERCSSSVENVDISDKTRVEILWVSPKQSTKTQVRIRAMVAENNEVWYTGPNLTVVLHKNTEKAPDSPPVEPTPTCNLCSEARYEVIFYGKWSRVAHPRHYPSKPDENGYSHMVGCSHVYNYTLWEQGSSASEGLRILAEETDSSPMEKEIISNMGTTSGTRTLIRGKRRHHPYMSEPSHALFRVDRYHHLFSIAVGMRPSPDWFLGTSKFELCTKDGWLKESEIPLYPWDAGTMDGVSYESPRTVSTTKDNVDRVEVGSFNQESPFYQINLNNLKPFAILKVRRLDVFPLIGAECSEDDQGEDEPPEVEEIVEVSDDEPEEPVLGEVRQRLDYPEKCLTSEWGSWSPCIFDDGDCGSGFRTRSRLRSDTNIYKKNYDYQDNLRTQPSSNCEDKNAKSVEYQDCFVDC